MKTHNLRTTESIKNRLIRSPTIVCIAPRIYSHVQYFLPRGLALPPLSVALIVTLRCTLRCRMCYYHRDEIFDETAKTIKDNKNKELSLDEIRLLIDDLAKMGVKSISMHGGEPLIRNDIVDIVRYIKQKGLLVTIFTNGTPCVFG